jgi:L-fucose/D-arabinose isomerase
MNMEKQFNLGWITFDYPPIYKKKEAPPESPPSESALLDLLKDNSFSVANPINAIESTGISPGGIQDAKDLDASICFFKEKNVDCLIIELNHWTRVSLVIKLITELNLPAALVANTTGGRNGITAVTAASSSIREIDWGRTVNIHERFLDTDVDKLLLWLRSVRTAVLLKQSRIMSFGGSYGADIPFTRSDYSQLERSFVSEILTEQEIVIIENAKAILAGAPQRIDSFITWLENKKTRIAYDNKMVTPETLRFQIAMYLAVRDRLAELKGENIAGISIKCHFEVSTTCIGCTECLIPAFLPFSEDSEGGQSAMPVACEGDIHGLIGLMILHALNPSVPPLFGDLITYKNDHILLRNCGSSSVYWAGKSNDPDISLPKVELLPNIHGRSGAAVHYETPACETITIARLFRIRGEFYLFYGMGKILAESESTRYTDPWPHTRLSFESDPQLFFKSAPCNHTSITEGDYSEELRLLARQLGIKTVRCDRDEDLLRFINKEVYI